MADIKTSDGLKIKGTITIRAYRAGFVEIAEYILELMKKTDAEAVRDGLRKVLDEIRVDFALGAPIITENIVVDSPGYGIDLIIQRLVGTNTYSLNLLYCELGTGQTAPALGDTALGAPVVRAFVAFQQDYGATDAIVQYFFSDAVLPNNTYYETGCFVDGTPTLGSGGMFDHALLSAPYIKISGQDTTVEFDFNIANS